MSDDVKVGVDPFGFVPLEQEDGYALVFDATADPADPLAPKYAIIGGYGTGDPARFAHFHRYHDLAEALADFPPDPFDACVVQWRPEDFEEALRQALAEGSFEGPEDVDPSVVASLVPELLLRTRAMEAWRDRATEMGNDMLLDAARDMVSEL